MDHNCCLECELPLVKQSIDRRTGLPLTINERADLKHYENVYAHSDSCESCDEFCSYDLRKPVPSTFLCTDCGGLGVHSPQRFKAQSRNPKFKRGRLLFQSSCNMWSCPNHGTAPYDRLVEEHKLKL